VAAIRPQRLLASRAVANLAELPYDHLKGLGFCHSRSQQPGRISQKKYAELPYAPHVAALRMEIHSQVRGGSSLGLPHHLLWAPCHLWLLARHLRKTPRRRCRPPPPPAAAARHLRKTPTRPPAARRPSQHNVCWLPRVVRQPHLDLPPALDHPPPSPWVSASVLVRRLPEGLSPLPSPSHNNGGASPAAVQSGTPMGVPSPLSFQYLIKI